MNHANEIALYELERQKGVIRDRVHDVALRRHTSLCLTGPGGTSKTHIVRTALDDVGEPYHYHSGHLTPLGFFDMLKEHADDVIVLDDVGSLFRDKIGQQLLLASLGTQYSGEWTRVVRYQRRGKDEVVNFSGGVIAISNLELVGNEIMDALKSRTKPLRWDPSETQLAALMRDAVKGGWRRDQMELTPEECGEVVEFIISECRRYNVRLDLRLLFNGALPDYAATKMQEHAVHWKDHTTMLIRQQVRRLQHSPGAQTREERVELERRIAERIRAAHGTRKEQVEAWVAETGKSERAFDRRSSELRLAK